MEEKLDKYKKKLEAILFAAGKRLSLEDLSRLTRIRDKDELKASLEELKKEYDSKNTSLIIESIEEEGAEYWKLTVKSHLIPLIKKIVTKTELTKSVIETLAYIAYKYPIKQSDLIKVRSNKAYDHLRELEKAGYIMRQKYGRTKVIKLTNKFFDYFDLPPEKIKEQFKDFEQLEKDIEDKEEDVRQIIEEQKKKVEEMKKKSEEEKKEYGAMEPDLDQIEIDLIDDKGYKKKLELFKENEEKETSEGKKRLEVYEGIPSGKVEVVEEKPEIKEIEEKLGELNVVEEAIPDIAEQMKKKKKPEHIGKLEVFGEKEPGAEQRADAKEEALEEGAEEELAEDKTVAGTEEEPPEEGIEDEIRVQKDQLKPEKEPEFGHGFSKEVAEIMDKKAEKRVEEMLHPKKEKKTEIEEEKIKIPAPHVKEETEKEEEEEKERDEEEIIKEKREEALPEDEKTAGLPAMDTFEEEKKEDSEK